jgi:hypothetical protein
MLNGDKCELEDVHISFIIFHRQTEAKGNVHKLPPTGIPHGDIDKAY